MKLLGFSLLLAGWALILATLAMLRTASAQTTFVLAGFAVELVGLVLVARAHLPAREERG